MSIDTVSVNEDNIQVAADSIRLTLDSVHQYQASFSNILPFDNYFIRGVHTAISYERGTYARAQIFRECARMSAYDGGNASAPPHGMICSACLGAVSKLY